MSAMIDSKLWQRTLEDPHDGTDPARQRLKTALINMRSRTAELVQLIPGDCKGLTVHDVTHLDALWEMADLIAGDNFPINPAEAFVWGAAVLIHDAGMTIAAYPGGINDLVQTDEWKDIAFLYLKENGIEPSSLLIQSPPFNLRSSIIFSVLRRLHARQAENLVAAQWPLPSTKDSVRLLEDQQLRAAFGHSIGRIASSHHLDISRLTQQLRPSVGAASDTPPAWTVNEVKLACLLRCADAAHMDRRRAPSVAYALTKPEGISSLHWNFQNKMNKPTI